MWADTNENQIDSVHTIGTRLKMAFQGGTIDTVATLFYNDRDDDRGAGQDNDRDAHRGADQDTDRDAYRGDNWTPNRPPTVTASRPPTRTSTGRQDDDWDGYQDVDQDVERKPPDTPYTIQGSH